MIACSGMALVMAQGQPKWPSKSDIGPVQLLQGKYQGHTTTSNHGIIY